MSNDPKITPGNEIRQALFTANQLELERIAVQIMREYPVSSKDFDIVCVNTNDPIWEYHLSCLMQDYDWQSSDNEGDTVISAGVDPGVCKNLAELVPSLKRITSTIFPEEVVRVFIFDDKGVSIQAIDFRLN